jgi:hypothetical protein
LAWLRTNTSAPSSVSFHISSGRAALEAFRRSQSDVHINGRVRETRGRTLLGRVRCRAGASAAGEFRRLVIRRGAPRRSSAYPDCLPCSISASILLRGTLAVVSSKFPRHCWHQCLAHSRYTRAEISIACAKRALTAINSVRNVHRTPHGSEQVPVDGALSAAWPSRGATER